MKIKKIIDKIVHSSLLWPFFGLVIKRYQQKDILNINLDLTSTDQKRVLICYVSIYGIDISNTYHALYFHLNQMIRCFIQQNYVIDICDCLDKTAPYRFKDKQYDLIIGQGPAYIEICKNHSNSKKVLFCTENNPIVVEQKYHERAKYFLERHPELKKYINKRRIMFFTKEHLILSDELILMNSVYNEQSFKQYFRNVYKINVNAIVNPIFNINKLNANISAIKNNFLVFGCTGFLHKGIDILLDTFRFLPNVNLLIYGINDGEKPLFNKLKSTNTIDCGFVNVSSPDFISKVVYQSLFVILPSCSEGMSSGIATCMCHGLIPIITKDCGFDDNEDIIVLPDFTIETITKTINDLVTIDDEELRSRRLRLIEYANNQFSIERFTDSFNEIFNKINKK